MISMTRLPAAGMKAAAVKFGNQPAAETEAKLKEAWPNFPASHLGRLAQFATRLTDEGRQKLYDELTTLGQLENKGQFLNPDFARLELAELILEIKWPSDFTPDMMVEDTIHVTRRRNRERGVPDYDSLGLKMLVGQARQEVTAMRVEEDLRLKGVNPSIIAATKKSIEEDLSYIGDALRQVTGQ